MIGKDFTPINLIDFLKNSELLNPYKEHFEMYVTDFAFKAVDLWSSDKEKAYENASLFVEHVPESILLEFMKLIDNLKEIDPEGLMEIVKELEYKTKYEFEKELIAFPKAIAYFYQFDMDDCINECKNIIKLYGNFNEIHFLIANCHTIKLRYDEAIPHFKYAIKSEQFGNEAKGNLAYCYLMLRKTRKAKRLFKEVVDIFSTNYKIQYNMALCYSRLRRRKKALVYLDRAENIESEFGGIYLTRGHIHLILGNKELAKKDLKKAKSLGSTKADELIKRL